MIIAEKQVNDFVSASKIGDYTINPYIGCPHACKYCYASFMKRFTNHSEDWGTFLDIKRAKKNINIKKLSGKSLVMSTVTDCYNPFEAKYKITRSILEQLVQSDCFLQILTKNKLVLRDIDLLKQMKHLTVAMSVNTLDDNFRQAMDSASSIPERLETLAALRSNNIHTILFMSPIFIYITNWQAIIETTQKYINEYWFEDLNLRGSYKWTILRYIKEKHPAIYPTYQRIYINGEFEEILRLNNEIKTYCDKHKIVHSDYFHHDEMMASRKRVPKCD